MYDLPIPEGFARLNSQAANDAALLRASTDLFVQQAAHDRDAIRRYEDLALHLLPRVAARDRVHVATRLAGRIDAPLGVVRMLARDAIDVAEPVLARSSVLSAFDLLTVIASTGPEHHRLIARRPGLGPDVVRALRLTGDPDVLAIFDSKAEKDLGPQGGKPTSVQDALPADQDRSYRAARSPWAFLALDRDARLAILRDVAILPPERLRPASESVPDRAFRSILGAAKVAGYARKGDRTSLRSTLGDSLGLAPDFIDACLDDATGEPLAVILKALALNAAQARQVMLLASPVGRDVSGFFRVCDLFAGMEQQVAEALAATWSAEDPVGGARHLPHFDDTQDGPRRAAAPAAQRAGEFERKADRRA